MELKNITLMEDLNNKTEEEFNLALNCFKYSEMFFKNMIKKIGFKDCSLNILKQYKIKDTNYSIHRITLSACTEPKSIFENSYKYIGSFLLIYDKSSIIHIFIETENMTEEKIIDYFKNLENKNSIEIDKIQEFIKEQYKIGRSPLISLVLN